MEPSIFDRITVNQDEFLNALFWQLSGQVSVPRSGWGVPKQSFGIVPAGVFEFTARADNQQPTWNQAGWLAVYSYQQYCFSQWVPLGQSFIFLPPEREEYELFFSPVRWVFGLTAELKQFTGEWSERLRNIEAKLETLESPTDVVLNYLTGPDSPLEEIQEQIEGIPDQITDTFEILLDAGEINDGP